MYIFMIFLFCSVIGILVVAKVEPVSLGDTLQVLFACNGCKLRTGSVGLECQTVYVQNKDATLSRNCSKKHVCCWESTRQDPLRITPKEMDKSEICIGQ